MKAVFIFTLSILFCYPAFAQSAVPAVVSSTGVEEVYLAKDNGEGKAGEQVSEFRTTDVPIYCVVLLESNAKTVVKMNFVAVSVSGVKPDTKVVTASYTTSQGQNRVNFTGRPDGKWTPGRYRVDLFLDGKLVKNLEFEIKSGAGTVTAAQYLQSPETPKPKSARRPNKNQPQ